MPAQERVNNLALIRRFHLPRLSPTAPPAVLLHVEFPRSTSCTETIPCRNENAHLNLLPRRDRHRIASRPDESIGTAGRERREQAASDAHQIKVTVTADGIQIPKSIDGGKTAFLVRNASQEKLTLSARGPEAKENFELTLPAGETRIVQVELRPGVYQTSCVIKGHEEKQVAVNLTVR